MSEYNERTLNVKTYPNMNIFLCKRNLRIVMITKNITSAKIAVKIRYNAWKFISSTTKISSGTSPKKIPKHTRNQKILSFLFSLFFWHSLWTQCISFPMQNVEISSSTQIMIKQIKIWKQNKAEHGKRLQIAKMPPALPYVLKTSCNVLLNTEWKQLRKATLRRS